MATGTAWRYGTAVHGTPRVPLDRGKLLNGMDVCRTTKAVETSMTGWMECETAGIPGAVRVDLRQADRFPMRSSLRVCGFENSGKELSAAGMAFLAREALAPGMLVHVELLNSRRIARARVRSCGRRGCAWRVGVEFEGSFA
jgi:hypothetical protein